MIDTIEKGALAQLAQLLQARGCEGELRIGREFGKALVAEIAALTPPEGYVLVPVEPTEDMLQAGYPRNERIDETFDRLGAWADMLAARPEVP